VKTAPTVVGGSVYFGSCDGYFYAVDKTNGQLQWKYDITQDGDVDGFHRNAVVSDGIIYIGSDLAGRWWGDGMVHAFDTKSGEAKWKFLVKNGDGVLITPCIDGNKIYFGADDHRFYVLDKNTAEVLWKFETKGDMKSSPVIDGDLVYFGSADHNFYALDKNTGELKWKRNIGRSIQSSPGVFNGEIFFGANAGSLFGGSGKLYALDKATGEVNWTYETDGDIVSSPIVENGRLYFGCHDGYFYAIDIPSRQLKWKYQTHGKITTFRPTLNHGKLYFGSWDDYIYCVEMETGSLVWKYKTGGDVRGGFGLADGVLFAGSKDGKVYALLVE